MALRREPTSRSSGNNPKLDQFAGPMIASLLGEDNRWVSAQRIEVSGGQGI